MKYEIVSRASRENIPVIYIPSVHENRDLFLQELGEYADRAVFVFLSDFDWNRDLSPWPAKGVFKGAGDFGGEADTFLKELLQEVVPQVTATVGDKIPWSGIAGYSLAGLFAIYSLYRTDHFARAASVSGSLWYDDFPAFAGEKVFKKKPERVYFSLGDKEAKARNARMSAVLDCTRSIYDICREQDIDTVFELNQGNHFQEPEKRLAKGVAWII